MLFSLRFLAAALAFVASALAAFPNPGPITGSFDGIHDPTVAKGPDGLYYVYSTGKGIPIHTSPDRTKWTFAGLVFPNGAPSSTDQYTLTKNGDLWAPDVTYVGGKFIMYYSASSFGTQNSAIFMATSTTGKAGSWTDQGKVLSSSTSTSFNAIDPNLVIDGSSWYLTWGSFWNGIYIGSINPSSGKLSSTSYTSIASRNGGAIEAPFIRKEGSYYYLFTSWDNCCKALKSTYNTRVVRATNIKGPYVDQSGKSALNGGGTQILASHGTTIGPGGGSFFKDSDAVAFFYHWYTAKTSNLGINLVKFTNGWPVVY